ncbi:uncharacterized protein [Anoplolepis gracilipes]|uniref:uncharacterized protein isoform X2 n=1 Tax=Anoplolepis gracilipes TaxID=354296 RepID=UPI003BA2CAAF
MSKVTRLSSNTYKNRLETEPNNSDILGHMKRVQMYIISLGKKQNEVVQRLRKEVTALMADNANGSKVSIAALLGLNNNHIMNNNETKHETAANGFETKSSKEDYEEIVRNGDVHHLPAQDNDCTKLPSPSSVETISGEDDVVTVSMDENSDEKQEEEKQKEPKIELMEEEDFLGSLGLITQARCAELQNRRVERKRRSTANSNFVYQTYNQQPSKRRRLYSYFQSENAPHTRQTTARMNGPSPPPNKTQPVKSTSPPAQTVTKSLIPVQKSTTRPNILRNADSKVFVNKNKIEDNQMRSSVPSAKSVQQISNKAVHIPGLPASLTIERIGNEPVVCICCRNPDSLTVCKNCSSNYHVSCHTRSLVPSRICPRCVLAIDEEEGVGKDEDAEIKSEAEAENKLPRYKKNEKLAATAHASGAVGKARENSEVYKTAGGFHKIDTTQKKSILSTAFGINHLPSSTFLIPITSNNTSSSNVDQSESSKFIDIEQRQNIASCNIDQHSRSNITYIQAEEQVPHSYQLSGTTIQPEKHQSYLIIKKITEPTGRSDQPLGGETEDQNHSAVFNYQLPTSGSATLQAGFQPLVSNSLFYDRNIRKKQNNRAASLHCVTVPKLSNSLNPVSNDYQLDRATLNGRKPWAKLSGGKLCIKQSTRSTTETLLPFYDDAENNGNEPESGGPTEETAATNVDSRNKHGSRSGAFIHSLFPGHNKSYTIAGRPRELRSLGPNDRDYPLLRQQLCRAEHELESREQSDSKPAAVQLQRRALTRFFEHVKLEEAHIPAPLGTKLAHKDEVSDDEIVREDAPIQRYDDDDAVAETPLLTSCDDLDEDRLIVRFPWVERDTVSENSRDDNAADKSPPVRSTLDIALIKPSDDFSDQVELTCVNAQSSCAMAFRQSVENDYPAASVLSINTYHAKQHQNNEAAAVAMRIAQSNLSDLHNKVSVPDDKADTERQDLPSGRRLRSRSVSSSSSGHSDTPEQAMNANDFSDDFEILAIGIVSPQEKREELRRHESATASKTDRSDAATG